MFSRLEAVRVRPVWASQSESLRRRCEREDVEALVWESVGLSVEWPKPWDVRAPERAGVGPSGRWIETWLRAFFFNLVWLLALERAGEFVRMPPGDGSPEICDIDEEVWSSEVSGSKYCE